MMVIREGLAALPADVSHVVGQPPRLEEIFTPYRHSLAIDPDLPIVVGARGTGKSFWASVFTDNDLRADLAPRYSRLRLSDVVARPGFVDQALPGAISRNTLDEILADDPNLAGKVWLLVALRAAEDVLDNTTFRTYSEGVEVYRSSEKLENRLREVDETLSQRSKKLVVVFDALDRLSNTWDAMRSRTTALLETLLSLRAYKSIKFKLFMRPEQLSSVPAAFTDLSKLRAGAFDLRWSALDLYGLAFTQLLHDGTTNAAFKSMLAGLHIGSPDVVNGKDQLPFTVLRDPATQEKIFTTMAGHYMGNDARRGRTYTWLTKHLSDTKNRLTPRSFLLALGEAARHERMPSPIHALTIEGIKHGVSAASVLRVTQLKDEYGWIDLALQPLAGQEVPCEAEAIYRRWFEADTLKTIRDQSKGAGYLLPFAGDYSNDESVADLMIAMMDIGIIEMRADERVNIPDLFRIAALMLRRGGPAPLPQR
jgi:hypothetical protein